ncbi:cylicin-2 [Narcine bancroftii]|uniref:cylicin-2 n=1 Tax=Narcine bancroftii TaxID=1343680 RepID=UPI0038322292
MGPHLHMDVVSPCSKGRNCSKLPPISRRPPEPVAPLTRLDLLKEQLHQKLEMEKQAKLTTIYRMQYQQALQRLRTTCLQQAHLVPRWAPGPRGKRGPGIDRSHSLKPLEPPGSVVSNAPDRPRDRELEGQSPGIPLTTAQPRCRDQEQEQLHSPAGWGLGHDPLWSHCLMLRLSHRESLVQQQLRNIEEELWQIQSQREESREGMGDWERSMGQKVEGERSRKERSHRVRSARAEGKRSERKRSERSGRLERKRSGRSEGERSEGERSEGDWERSEGDWERSERMGRKKSGKSKGERSEQVRAGRLERKRSGRTEGERSEAGESEGERSEAGESEGERSEAGESEGERLWRERSCRSEGKRSGRLEWERTGRKRLEGDRSGRSERRRSEGECSGRLERERSGRTNSGRERAVLEKGTIEQENWERKDKERLGEAQRERDKLRRSRGHGREWGAEDALREKGVNRGAEVTEESCWSVEQERHSKLLADDREAVRGEAGTRDKGTEGAEKRGGSYTTEWNGHYSPEEKTHCSFCGRRFVLDRLETHMEICRKVHRRKRKVYDSALKRAKGTDLENYQCSHKVIPVPKADWKKKHDCFMRMLHAAQQAELEVYRRRKAVQSATPVATLNVHFLQCPHCSRRFDPSLAHQHISKCRSLRFRTSPPRR